MPISKGIEYVSKTMLTCANYARDLLFFCYKVDP